jgi:hypothetical protein
MKKQPRHLIDEADIGSGEKTPAEHETDKMIQELDHPIDKKPHGRNQPAGGVSQKGQGPAAQKEH